MNNKKAIELSINFIVVMILSIAILSASFVLVNQFFGKAGEMKARLDSETETKIRALLVGNERVAIPLHTKEVKVGDFVSFGVGISNILKGGTTQDTFKVFVEGDNCVAIGGGSNIPTQYLPTVDISKNDQAIVLIGVDTTNAQRGKTYKCDIRVQYSDPDTGADVDYADPVYKAYIKTK